MTHVKIDMSQRGTDMGRENISSGSVVIGMFFFGLRLYKAQARVHLHMADR